MAEGFQTHTVANQPPPLSGVNWLRADTALVEGLAREGAGFAEDRVDPFGEILGRADTIALARDANRHTPELNTHDRFGHRIDEVEFHPAWHAIMSLAMEHGVPRTGGLIPHPVLDIS